MNVYSGKIFSYDEIAEEIKLNGVFQGHALMEDCFADPSKNPRRNVNKAELQKLETDILERGIRHNLECNIRPDIRKIEVRAGYTRFSVAKKHGFHSVFVAVYDQSESESTISAARENMLRTNLSPVEEGIYAERRLTELKNDTQELLLELGWTNEKLQSRLAITKVTAAVRDALVQQLIKIGHVQLLATLSEESQGKLLEEILTRKLEVSETRELIESKQIPLSLACFDKSDCHSCQYNSQKHLDLFEPDAASLGANCRNTKCFREKTKAALDLIVQEKQEEFGTVRFDKDTTPNTFIKLVEVGADGIGSDNIAACSDCQHYGCVISTKKETAGTVTSPVCFDRECNSQKRDDYQQSLQPQKSGIKATSSKQTANKESKKQNQKSTPKKSKAASTTATTKPEETQSEMTFSKGLRAYYVDNVSTIVAEQIKRCPDVKRVISIFALFREFKRSFHDTMTRLMEIENQDKYLTLDEPKIFSFLLNCSDNQLDEIEEQLAMLFVKHLENQYSFEKDTFFNFTIEVLRYLNVDVKDHWSVNESYIKLLTKASISKHLEDSGFKEAFINSKGEAAYRNLMNSKVAELPKLIMSFTEFDWKNYLPESMNLHSR